jgi:hypothetical protein
VTLSLQSETPEAHQAKEVRSGTTPRKQPLEERI